MIPKIHFLFGILISSLIYFFFPNISLFYLGILVFSTVFIDIDHYFWWIKKKKSFNIFKAYKWFKSKKLAKKKSKKIVLCLFHGIEWIIIFFILGLFFCRCFYFAGLGIFLHLILDWIEIYRKNYTFFKISVIYDFFRN